MRPQTQTLTVENSSWEKIKLIGGLIQPKALLKMDVRQRPQWQMCAPLGVYHQRGEVLLLGICTEVVVSNAIPLVVYKAYESDDEEEGKSNSQTGQTNCLQSSTVIL